MLCTPYLFIYNTSILTYDTSTSPYIPLINAHIHIARTGILVCMHRFGDGWMWTWHNGRARACETNTIWGGREGGGLRGRYTGRRNTVWSGDKTQDTTPIPVQPISFSQVNFSVIKEGACTKKYEYSYTSYIIFTVTV